MVVGWALGPILNVLCQNAVCNKFVFGVRWMMNFMELRDNSKSATTRRKLNGNYVKNFISQMVSGRILIFGLFLVFVFSEKIRNSVIGSIVCAR